MSPDGHRPSWLVRWGAQGGPAKPSWGVEEGRWKLGGSSLLCSHWLLGLRSAFSGTGSGCVVQDLEPWEAVIRATGKGVSLSSYRAVTKPGPTGLTQRLRAELLLEPC